MLLEQNSSSRTRSSLSELLFSIAPLGCSRQTSSAITRTGNERQNEPFAVTGTITPTGNPLETTTTSSLNLSTTTTSIVLATPEMQDTTLLSGIITLESQDTIPLLSSLDLRNPENFNLNKQTETSQDGSNRRGVILDTVSRESAVKMAVNIQSPIKSDEDLFAVCQEVSLSADIPQQQLDLKIICNKAREEVPAGVRYLDLPVWVHPPFTI